MRGDKKDKTLVETFWLATIQDQPTSQGRRTIE